MFCAKPNLTAFTGFSVFNALLRGLHDVYDINYTEKNPLLMNLTEPILSDCPASLDMCFIACMRMELQKMRDSLAGGLVLHDGPQANILHAVQHIIV